MNTERARSRGLVVAGLVGMIGAIIDPLEGCFIVAPATALVAMGATIGRSRHQRLAWRSVALVAVGVAALVFLSWLGGVGGKSGRSAWWLLAAVPYPVGWIAGLVAAGLALVESTRTSRQAVQGPPIDAGL